MESLIPLKQVTIEYNLKRRRKLYPPNPNSITRRNRYLNPNQRHLAITDKLHTDFLDFQRYAKPSRLVPATEPKICTETSSQEPSSLLNVPESQLFFRANLRTSSIYGSGLSNIYSGVLLCVIDSGGQSVLQRFPVVCKPSSNDSVDATDFERLHFQRGSVDKFTFTAPKLGLVDAVWLGVESGQWRVGGVSLTVVDLDRPSSDKNESGMDYKCLQYEFEVDDILLGEGRDLSMVELRPSCVSELSGVDSLNLLSKNSPEPIPVSTISKEEGMREYTDLKLSLLLYDAILSFAGTTVVNFSAGETDAFAFLAGGIVGFLYLLLLQRSVDGLPASVSVSQNTSVFDRLFGGIKGPISSLALAVGLTLLVLKYGLKDMSSVLTPKELLIGMVGFLVCKVAVVLAAFKPMTLRPKGDE